MKLDMNDDGEFRVAGK